MVNLMCLKFTCFKCFNFLAGSRTRWSKASLPRKRTPRTTSWRYKSNHRGNRRSTGTWAHKIWRLGKKGSCHRFLTMHKKAYFLEQIKDNLISTKIFNIKTNFFVWRQTSAIIYIQYFLVLNGILNRSFDVSK